MSDGSTNLRAVVPDATTKILKKYKIALKVEGQGQRSGSNAPIFIQPIKLGRYTLPREIDVIYSFICSFVHSYISLI